MFHSQASQLMQHGALRFKPIHPASANLIIGFNGVTVNLADVARSALPQEIFIKMSGVKTGNTDKG